MAYKCCVPNCTPKANFPSHKVPMDPVKRKIWLQAINRYDLINASKEILAKLRICAEHFPQDMVFEYGKLRRLKDWAVPTLQIPSLNIQNVENIHNNSTEEISENIQDNANLAVIFPAAATVSEKIDNRQKDVYVQTVYNDVHDLRYKLHRCQCQLWKKNLLIRKQRKHLKRLQQNEMENKWKEIIKSMNDTQRTFFQMVGSNFKCAPEGRRYEAKEKSLALMLYKMIGKRAYNCLRNIFSSIPSIHTLQLEQHKISTYPEPFNSEISGECSSKDDN